MWAAVLLFALSAAQDPVRIGIMAILISRPRPMHNLFAYWLGLMVTGFGAGLAALFLLRDFMLPVVQFVTSAARNPVVPHVQIVVGVLALSTAAMLALRPPMRQVAQAPMPGGDASALMVKTKTATLSSRLSWARLVEGESTRMAFVAGLCTSTQILEFWGAMMVILASGAGTGTQVGAALMFTLVALAITEIPLVSCLVSPAKTQYVVMQLHGWLCAHRRPIFVFILCVVGVWMVVNGVGKF